MTTELPGRSAPLGRDVPRLADGAMFPAELQTLELPALRALLARLDRTPDTARGSAARDWHELGDRMNYIVDLFRSRQQEPHMRSPVFSSARGRSGPVRCRAVRCERARLTRPGISAPGAAARRAARAGAAAGA